MSQNFDPIKKLTEITPPVAKKDRGDRTRFNTLAESNLDDQAQMAVDINADFIPKVNTIAKELPGIANNAAASATAAKVSENAAAASKNTAATSAANAKTSENAAKTSQTQAASAATAAQAAQAVCEGIEDTLLTGATPAATPNTPMRRDGAARAKVAAPSDAGDIANKQYVDTAATGVNVPVSTPQGGQSPSPGIPTNLPTPLNTWLTTARNCLQWLVNRITPMPYIPANYSLSMYIDTVNGSNSNDGLSESTAFKTLATLYIKANQYIKTVPVNLTVYFSDGAYGNITIASEYFSAFNSVTLNFSKGASVGALNIQGAGLGVNINGATIDYVTCSNNSFATLDKCTFASNATSGTSIYVRNNGELAIRDVTFSGTRSQAVSAQSGGKVVFLTNGTTEFISGTTYTTAFLYTHSFGRILWESRPAPIGSFSGMKYRVSRTSSSIGFYGETTLDPILPGSINGVLDSAGNTQIGGLNHVVNITSSSLPGQIANKQYVDNASAKAFGFISNEAGIFFSKNVSYVQKTSAGTYLIVMNTQLGMHKFGVIATPHNSLNNVVSPRSCEVYINDNTSFYVMTRSNNAFIDSSFFFSVF